MKKVKVKCNLCKKVIKEYTLKANQLPEEEMEECKKMLDLKSDHFNLNLIIKDTCHEKCIDELEESIFTSKIKDYYEKEYGEEK